MLLPQTSRLPPLSTQSTQHSGNVQAHGQTSTKDSAHGHVDWPPPLAGSGCNPSRTRGSLDLLARDVAVALVRDLEPVEPGDGLVGEALHLAHVDLEALVLKLLLPRLHDLGALVGLPARQIVAATTVSDGLLEGRPLGEALRGAQVLDALAPGLQEVLLGVLVLAHPLAVDARGHRLHLLEEVVLDLSARKRPGAQASAHVC